MNKISEEKRKQMAGIAAGALVVAGLIWYFLISGPSERLVKLRESNTEFENKLYRADTWIKRTNKVAAELADLKQQLEKAESTMPTPAQLNGNNWLRDMLARFIQTNRHDFILMKLHQEPVKGKQSIIIPNFAYEGAAYELDARAFYHDLGRFLADFESSNPCIRVQDLRMSPIATPSASTGPTADLPEGLIESEDREQLRISMKLVLLFKPPRAAL